MVDHWRQTWHGVDFAKAALAAGHAVVASGRDSDRVSEVLGQSNDLLAVKLDTSSMYL